MGLRVRTCVATTIMVSSGSFFRSSLTLVAASALFLVSYDLEPITLPVECKEKLCTLQYYIINNWTKSKSKLIIRNSL